MNADLIFVLAVSFTNGTVLTANNVTAGNGMVIDWRNVKSGETVVSEGDAYDMAVTFVGLVGWGAAAMALDEKEAA